MNKKGFAITGFIYTIFVLFIVLMVAILALLNSRKNVLDNLKKTVRDNVNNVKTIPNVNEQYVKINQEETFIAPSDRYYEITLNSPTKDNKISKVIFSIFINRLETIYIYNDGNKVKVSDKNHKEIAHASIGDNVIEKEYLNRIVFDSDITTLTKSDSTGSVQIKKVEKETKNQNLNKVGYIKDCINGNEIDDDNIWSEIRAYDKTGNNVTQNKNVEIIDLDLSDRINPALSSSELITDGDLTTFSKASNSGEQCVVLNLDGTKNLSAISVLHKKDTLFYENRIYVSSNGVDWKLIRSLDEKESSVGLVVSAYDEPLIEKVGDVYVPIKILDDGSKWLRVFHHNNKKGTIFWDAIQQVTVDNGYDKEFKQSILYNLNQYAKDNKYEFLLEYSDLNTSIRWIQSSDLNSSSSPEEIIWPNPMTYTNFDGLHISGTKSYLASTTKQYYFIGYLNLNDSIDGIVVDDTHKTKEITNLWVRIG